MEIKTLSLSTFSRIPLSREFTRRESFDFDLLKPGKIPPPSPFPRDSFGSRGGKKKKREAASLLYQAAPSWKAPLHSNEDRWRTIGFSCLSLTSALASWHVNSNGERINLRPISSPLLCSEWRIYHSIIPGKRQSALVPSRRRRSKGNVSAPSFFLSSSKWDEGRGKIELLGVFPEKVYLLIH